MKAQDLKRSILQLAIQGKLVPQNPSDEPASELLKKIKAEKEALVKAGKIKKDKQESYIYKGSDNNYYEKIGTETKDITDEIPFEIPESWEWVKLSNFCKLDNGEKVSDVSLPLLDAKYLRGKSSENIMNSGILVNQDDYIILVDGENSGEVFKAPVNGIMGTTFKKLYISTNVYSDYTLYLLKYYQSMFRNSKRGAAIPHLDKNLFANLLVGLPPLSEQERIVKKIEELEPFIEEYGKAEVELTTLNSNFPEQIKKSILQYAIQGKLVEQDLNDEPASVLLEKIRAEKQELIKQGKIKKDKQESYIFKGADNRHYEKIGLETKDITDEIPFDIPSNWEWCRLGSIINIKSGDGLTSNQMAINGTIPVYGGNGIAGYHDKANIFEKSIVIGRVGFYCGCVHLTQEKAWITDNAFIVTYPKINISQDFLILILNIVNQNKSDNGTAQPVISGKKIYPMLVPIPPLNEQKRIIDKITKLYEIIKNL